MPNTTGVTPGLLLKGLNEVFYQNYLTSPAGMITSDEIFKFTTIDRGMTETDLALAGVGEFTTFGEQQNIPKQEVKERGTTVYQMDLFANGFDVSYKMLLADEAGRNTIDMAAELGRAARTTQEKNRLAVLRLAATTTGIDGKALCATDHPLANGGTYGNLVATAFSYKTVKDMLQVLRQQQNYQGLAMPEDGAILVTGTALYDEAIEITKAEGIPGSANNDASFLSRAFPGLRVGYNPYLDATYGGSDTKFYILAPSRKLKVFIREGINTWMNDWNENANIVTKYNAKYAETAGFSDYYGVVQGGV